MTSILANEGARASEAAIRTGKSACGGQYTDIGRLALMNPPCASYICKKWELVALAIGVTLGGEAV